MSADLRGEEPAGAARPYSRRRAACGCAGVPDGQHLPGCELHAAVWAPSCPACGYRSAIDDGRCGICGTRREVPPAPAAPLLLSDAELEHPFGPGIEHPERLRWLRTAVHPRFRLDLWDGGEARAGGSVALAYRLCVAEGARWILVLSGEGIAGPAAGAIDPDRAVGTVLRLLAVRPGEADAADFDRYTPRQVAFAEEHGEGLALWAADLAERGRASAATGRSR